MTISARTIKHEIKATPREWFNIQARESDSGARVVQVDIYDEISYWGVSGQVLAPQIRDLRDDDELVIRLNTPGGDVDQGYAIANAVEAHRGRTIAVVDGVAASIGSVIFAAADERYMHRMSMLMWHAAWGVTVGNAQDMRDMADTLDKVTGQIVGVYARTTNLDTETIEGYLERDTYFTAEEAAEMEHAQVLDSSSVLAKMSNLQTFDFEARGFRNVPQSLVDASQEERRVQAKQEVAALELRDEQTRELQRRRMAHHLQQRKLDGLA